MKKFFAWLRDLLHRPLPALKPAPPTPQQPLPPPEVPPEEPPGPDPNAGKTPDQPAGVGDPSTYGVQSADINDVVDEEGNPR